ncbi:MAG: FAD-binding oxidoreductase [Gammaproteobacteria bacterium]
MDRRTFNKSLLAAGWAASFCSPSLLAATARAATKITGDIAAITRTGGDTTISKAALKELQAVLRGPLLLPGNAEYETTRKVWNGMIDKKPGLIVRCTGAADVIEAVNFARDFDLLVAVRGGGHSISGKSVCEGGIMIDLSPMSWCTVDPVTQTARLGAGSVLGLLDHESQRFGLATPAGTVSHTGAAGLTLGGGHGRLSRSFGLTCDNLKSVDIVTADGRFLRASAEENQDLYWGVRGGGGNFGVVTTFEYNLHKVGPTVYGGTLMYSLADARDVLKFYAEYTQETPRELAMDAFMLAPPSGKGMLAISPCFIGDLDKGNALLQPLRDFRKPKVDQSGPMLYNTIQTGADGGTAPGKLYYNKSGLMTALSNDFIDSLVARLETAHEQADPGVTSSCVIQHLGGAVADVAPGDTAYVHRDAHYDSVIMSAWTNPEHTAENTTWLRESYATAMQPHTIGLYINHAVDSDDTIADQRFRSNYERLVTLKNKYDPANLFHLNPNVTPTV